MKVFCKTCDLHFRNEFEKTLEPICNYWGAIGMSNVPVELKKKVWDWQFSAPIDEMVVSCKLSFSFVFSTTPIQKGDTFEEIIEGYSTMTDEERREAQREYFRNKKKEKEAEIASRGEGSVPDLSSLMHPQKEKVVN